MLKNMRVMLLLLLISLSITSAYHSLARIVPITRNAHCLSAVTVRIENSTPTLKRPMVSVILASENSLSTFKTKPFNGPVSWHEVMTQIAEKMRWEPINNVEHDSNGVNELENLSMEIHTLEDLIRMKAERGSGLSFGAEVVLIVGLSDNDAQGILTAEALRSYCTNSKAVVPLECTGSLCSSLEKYGAYVPLDPLESVKQVFDGILRGQRFKSKALKAIVTDLWSRKSSADILFMALVLADAFADVSIKSVASVTNTDSTSFSQIGCMISNCREEVFDCLGDPECKAALDCLNGCKGNDQVCSYRCITSHETAKFEKFAQCILQKNNCMGNTATAPVYPDPQPMTIFRGEELTHDAAEGIFIGHLEPRVGESNMLLAPEATKSHWSWKVLHAFNRFDHPFLPSFLILLPIFYLYHHRLSAGRTLHMIISRASIKYFTMIREARTPCGMTPSSR